MEQLQLPWPVVLASASPRRRELLRQVVDTFDVIPADIDEKEFQASDAVALARIIATRKAEAIFAIRPDAMVIAADTMVVLDAEVLNKPIDEAEASEMLTKLSGRTHLVITGTVLMWPREERIVFADSTRVTFRNLTPKEIDAYVLSGEPMDKAGAYAIQGGAAPFATHLEGDRDTVIGLPVRLIRVFLEQIADGTRTH